MLHHGACYYPELWPESGIERDIALGPEFTATVGRWGGAKVGVFAAGPGHADFDWFA